LRPPYPVIIEAHFWIGSKAGVLPGHIGSGAPTGAGSIVRKAIPPRGVATDPARVLHLRELD